MIDKLINAKNFIFELFKSFREINDEDLYVDDLLTFTYIEVFLFKILLLFFIVMLIVCIKKKIQSNKAEKSNSLKDCNEILNKTNINNHVLVLGAKWKREKYSVTWTVGKKSIKKEFLFEEPIIPPKFRKRIGYILKWDTEIPTYMPARELKINGEYIRVIKNK